MASFNKAILMGRLTAVPELKQTPSGSSVTTFNIAVDRRFAKQGDQADFISVVAFEKTAEFICRYFTKGSPILVCGEIHTRNWTDKQGHVHYATEVVALEANFCGTKAESVSTDIPKSQTASQEEFDGFQVIDTTSDEGLPF